MFRLTKRRKFIISSLFLSLGLVSVQLGLISDRYLAILALSLLTIPLVFWSLRESLKGSIWLTSWIIPVLFTTGVGLFYFLLPSSWITAVPVILIYFFGMYALFLSENIFSVAAIRTIQLFRSASAVSFLLTLLTAFLLYDTIWSFRLPFYFNGLLVLLVSFLLFLHGSWAVNLEEKITKKIVLYSLILSIGLGEIAIVISFWPVTVSLASLFLTSVVYVALGLGQANLNDRLFRKTVKEYLVVFSLVLLILLFYTTWG